MKNCGVFVRRHEEEVEVWASRGADETRIQATADRFMAEGCRVVIYRSGTGNVAALTAELLRANA